MFRNKTLLLALGLAACALSAHAQPWLRSGDAPLSLRAQEMSAWQSGHDLTATKGWKPYFRELWLQQGRVAEGQDARKAAQAWNDYFMGQLNNAGKAAGGGLWQPVGYFAPFNARWSGRVNCIAFSPTDVDVYYIGTPGGGVWRTNDDGLSWTPLTDDMPVPGVSTIVVDWSDGNNIYIGTGDADQGFVGVVSDSRSVGILKSTDGGSTWNTTGFSVTVESGTKVSRIAQNPGVPSTLLAATGTGIYQTIDGGTNWTLRQAGNFRDLVYHPTSGSVAYAATETTFYRSTNGGTSWDPITSGLPTSDVARIRIAASPASVDYVYLLISNASGSYKGFYRSTDQGATFTARNTTTTDLILYQGTYNLALAAHPFVADSVTAWAVIGSRSNDGGITWTTNISGPGNFVDIHDARYGPGGELFVCADQGVFKTWDDGATYTHLNWGLNISQNYRLAVGNTTTDTILATGVQDIAGVVKNAAAWASGAGGDGTDCAIDPADHMNVYSCGYTSINRSTDGGVTFPFTNINGGITGEAYNWILPFEVMGTTPNHIYAGYANLYKSTDAGASWVPISSWDPIYPNRIISLDVCDIDHNTIYIAREDSVFRTQDGGATWTSITAGITRGGNMINQIRVSPFDPDVVVLVVAGFSDGDKVFYSDTGGDVWTNISTGLPNIPANCAAFERLSVSHNLYVGMDDGVYHYDQATGTWTSYSDGLPRAIVTDIEVNTANNWLYVSTFGRGIHVSPLGLVGTQGGKPQDAWVGLYPNPAVEKVTLSVEADQDQQLTLRIYDLQGKLVSMPVSGKALQRGKHDLAVEVGGLAPGTYVWRAHMGSRIATGKLVKQ